MLLYDETKLRFTPPDWYNGVDENNYFNYADERKCKYHSCMIGTLEYNLRKLNKKKMMTNKDKDKTKAPKKLKTTQITLTRNGHLPPQQFDIPSLLSSSSRDYLIKNNGHKCQIKEYISGKHVALFFWTMRYDRDLPETQCAYLYEDLKEIYGNNNIRRQFEIVMVDVGYNEKVFNDAFSAWPWLAIPHEDQECRDLIDKKIAIPGSICGSCAFFDPNGTLLLDRCQTIFRSYGPEGFPFTREKIDEIGHADKALLEELMSLERPSLKNLLGEFVFSSEGKRVSTSELDHHIVALNCLVLSRFEDPSTKLLLDTWKSLKDNHNTKFAILFPSMRKMYPSYFKHHYHDKYRDIPWYTLPYDARRLCRVLRIPRCGGKSERNAVHFIIIEPDKFQPFNYFALDLLEKYGIGSFPFTLERAVQIEKKKAQMLKLCQLLSPLATLCRGCSTHYKEYTVSELLGKRVLLLFATNSSFRAGSFLVALGRMYFEKKDTKDQFEIIYISLDCTKSSFYMSIKKMPWLVHSFVPDFAVQLAAEVFGDYPCLPAIAAFGSSGSLQTRESDLLFKESWSSVFPFIQVDMADDFCEELIYGNFWTLKKLFPDYIISSDSDSDSEWLP